MQIVFKSRTPEAASLQALTEHRIRFVLRRLSWLVPRAEVKFTDINGPRGGIDKRCQVELRTDGAGTVVVSSVAADSRTALDKALERASRFLLRVWQRSKASRRTRPALAALET